MPVKMENTGLSCWEKQALEKAQPVTVFLTKTFLERAA
jgi:hypothetical protein